MEGSPNRKIPLIAKGAFSVFIVGWFFSNWVGNGLHSFLWICNASLLLVFLALIFESKLLASMALVGDFVYAVIWNIDFHATLVSPFKGMTGYMLGPNHLLWLRTFSLFHIALPVLMVWLIFRLGYDRRAWPLQFLLSTFLGYISWVVGGPDKNINGVYSYEKVAAFNMAPVLYLTLLTLVNGGVIFLTHWGTKFLSRLDLAKDE